MLSLYDGKRVSDELEKNSFLIFELPQLPAAYPVNLTLVNIYPFTRVSIRPFCVKYTNLINFCRASDCLYVWSSTGVHLAQNWCIKCVNWAYNLASKDLPAKPPGREEIRKWNKKFFRSIRDIFKTILVQHHDHRTRLDASEGVKAKMLRSPNLCSSWYKVA